MLPYIIMHVGVSLDGRMDYSAKGEGDPYYELSAHWKADADLSGSRTIAVAKFPEDPQWEFPGAYSIWKNDRESLPLLVVVDSQGQVHNWESIRMQPWWRSQVALCSIATPKSHLELLKFQKIDTILTGTDHVDLRAAMEQLYDRFKVRSLRIDSGGNLNGVMLRAGLVDEVSVVINPELIGGLSHSAMFTAPDLTSAEGVINLSLEHIERINKNYAWLRYKVIKIS